MGLSGVTSRLTSKELLRCRWMGTPTNLCMLIGTRAPPQQGMKILPEKCLGVSFPKASPPSEEKPYLASFNRTLNSLFLLCLGSNTGY